MSAALLQQGGHKGALGMGLHPQYLRLVLEKDKLWSIISTTPRMDVDWLEWGWLLEQRPCRPCSSRSNEGQAVALWRLPEIHVHPEPRNVTLFGNRTFASTIR